MNYKERRKLHRDLLHIERKLAQLFKDFHSDPRAVVDRLRDARAVRDDIRDKLILN